MLIDEGVASVSNETDNDKQTSIYKYLRYN